MNGKAFSVLVCLWCGLFVSVFAQSFPSKHLIPLFDRTGCTSWSCLFDRAEDYPGDWQGDLTDFEISGNALAHKSGKVSGTQLSYIYHPAPMGHCVVWEGSVRLRQSVSTRHHFSLLLCPFREDGDSDLKYICLNFGRLNRGIRLVVASLFPQGNGRQTLREEGTLITDFRHLLAAGDIIRFKLSYEATRGWILWVHTEGESVSTAPVGTSLFLPQGIEKHSYLGIAISYTNKTREGVSIDHLSVSASDTPDDNSPIVPDPGQDNDYLPSDWAGKVCINEIMARPLGGSAEYVELYNTTEAEVDLSQMALGIVRNGEVKTYYPLPEGVKLSPNGYIVLTEDATSLGTTYPHAPKELMCTMERWPRLANERCTIALLYMGENPFGVDVAEYDVSCFDKGLKRKSGVAAEKINPMIDGSRIASWKSALAPLYASPGQANTRLDSQISPDKEGKNDKEDSQRKVDDHSQSPGSISPRALADLLSSTLKKDKGLRSRLLIYDLNGQLCRHYGHKETLHWMQLQRGTIDFNLASSLKLFQSTYIVQVRIGREGKSEKELGHSVLSIRN